MIIVLFSLLKQSKLILPETLGFFEAHTPGNYLLSLLLVQGLVDTGERPDEFFTVEADIELFHLFGHWVEDVVKSRRDGWVFVNEICLDFFFIVCVQKIENCFEDCSLPYFYFSF